MRCTCTRAARAPAAVAVLVRARVDQDERPGGAVAVAAALEERERQLLALQRVLVDAAGRRGEAREQRAAQRRRSPGSAGRGRGRASSPRGRCRSTGAGRRARRRGRAASRPRRARRRRRRRRRTRLRAGPGRAGRRRSSARWPSRRRRPQARRRPSGARRPDAALVEVDDQRHAVHAVARAQPVLDEVGVVARDAVARVDLDREARRARADLGHVEQPQAVALLGRAAGGAWTTSERKRLSSGVGMRVAILSASAIASVEHAVDVAARQRAGGQHLRPQAQLAARRGRARGRGPPRSSRRRPTC